MAGASSSSLCTPQHDSVVARICLRRLMLVVTRLEFANNQLELRFAAISNQLANQLVATVAGARAVAAPSESAATSATSSDQSQNVYGPVLLMQQQQQQQRCLEAEPTYAKINKQ